MQAIVTKFLGPTDTKGDRIIARSDAGRVIVSYGYDGNVEAQHRKAAEALCVKLGWSTVGLCSGGLPNGKGYAFVFCSEVK